MRLGMLAAAVTLLAAGGLCGDDLPVMDPGACELHGLLHGQPFWARLLVSDPAFGNHRVLQLVYTPPTPEQMDGAHLSDCPFILLDDHLRVVAWNGRDTASSVVPAAKDAGYVISRDLLVGEGDAKHSEAVKRVLLGGGGWDLNIAPVLLALCWRDGSAAQVPVVDIFGPRWKEPLIVTWSQHQVQLAGQTWVAVADAQGRLKSLTTATGGAVLDVTGRP